MLYEGGIDIAPCSTFEYGLHPERYWLVPDISISAHREVQSVLLFSRVPIEKLQDRRVLLSPASATSNALLRILLEKCYGLRCLYDVGRETAGKLPPDADARVAIGNAALRDYLRGEGGEHVYDLAELWHDFTGLPFVFALWMLRRDAARARSAEIGQLIQALREARRMAPSRFEEFAGAAARTLDIAPADLLQYWHTIAYDLDEEKIVSLKRFFHDAEVLGLIPAAPALRFFECAPATSSGGEHRV
jgi:chorismate dehydratase